MIDPQLKDKVVLITGADHVIAAPLKIVRGSGSPLRVPALAPV